MKSDQLEEAPKKFGPVAIRALAICAQSIGAIAAGALAIGAVTLGVVAIGRLVIGRAKIKRLEIGELRVTRLNVTDSMVTPPPVVSVVEVVVVCVVDVVVAAPHEIRPCRHASMTSFAHCDRFFPVKEAHDASIWARHDGRLHGGGVSAAAGLPIAVSNENAATQRSSGWTTSRMEPLPPGKRVGARVAVLAERLAWNGAADNTDKSGGRLATLGPERDFTP